MLECKTYRYSGHSRADAGTYRPDGELQKWLDRDPIVLYRRYLIDTGLLDDARADQLEVDVTARVEACVERTLAMEPADVASMFCNVWAPVLAGKS